MEVKMTIETVKMSSKGQIVIPMDVREELNAHTGTVFAVVGTKDTIVLKKIAMPNKEDLIKDLGLLAKKTKKKLQSKGFTEKDLQAK
ncbi:MAG: AbrB/MazE/SpoVT family DNA-binding domain-containing protein [Candidatus Pacearchaeota archaeon]|nr:AbrB/MazE/SpoVT family DNA-binding domain-containing protein [Candidatus Pacearchaeota archaeon]